MNVLMCSFVGLRGSEDVSIYHVFMHFGTTASAIDVGQCFEWREGEKQNARCWVSGSILVWRSYVDGVLWDHVVEDSLLWKMREERTNVISLS